MMFHSWGSKLLAKRKNSSFKSKTLPSSGSLRSRYIQGFERTSGTRLLEDRARFICLAMWIPPPQDTGCSWVEILKMKELSPCTTKVHGIMNLSWNMLGMSSHDLGTMAVRSSGVSPFILSSKERSTIRFSDTPSYTILNDIRVISTPDKFSNFASFSIISFILVSSLYNPRFNSE